VTLHIGIEDVAVADIRNSRPTNAALEAVVYGPQRSGPLALTTVKSSENAPVTSIILGPINRLPPHSGGDPPITSVPTSTLKPDWVTLVVTGHVHVEKSDTENVTVPL
jgi:hypothetical protein